MIERRLGNVDDLGAAKPCSDEIELGSMLTSKFSFKALPLDSVLDRHKGPVSEHLIRVLASVLGNTK